MLFEKEGPDGQRSIKHLFEKYKERQAAKLYKVENTAMAQRI